MHTVSQKVGYASTRLRIAYAKFLTRHKATSCDAWPPQEPPDPYRLRNAARAQVDVLDKASGVVALYNTPVDSPNKAAHTTAAVHDALKDVPSFWFGQRSKVYHTSPKCQSLLRVKAELLNSQDVGNRQLCKICARRAIPTASEPKPQPALGPHPNGLRGATDIGWAHEPKPPHTLQQRGARQPHMQYNGLTNKPKPPRTVQLWEERQQQMQTIKKKKEERKSQQLAKQAAEETELLRRLGLPESHREKEPEVALTHEQRYIFRRVMEGESLFFTGCAGTGKSYLLRHLARHLITKHPRGVYITAPTGLAANNIGGTTLHYWAGIGVGARTVAEMRKRATDTRKKQWKSAKVLIIDEVSMVSGDLLDSLNALAQQMKGSTQFFGGLQLVLCGDFLQLPPIVKQKKKQKQFAFEANCWGSLVQHNVELTKVFRQANHDFVAILDQVRTACLDANAIEVLQSRINVNVESDGIKPTQLFPLRREVQGINQSELKMLPGEERCYQATDTGDPRLVQDCGVQELVLKQGAQVVLLKNLNAQGQLFNGSRGVVAGFAWNGDPLVQFKAGNKPVRIKVHTWTAVEDGIQVASRQQYPLALAWALTIHKSQGLGLDCVQIGLGNIFEHGQAYTALSRAKYLEALSLTSFDPNSIMAHPKAVEFHDRLRRNSRHLKADGAEGE